MQNYKELIDELDEKKSLREVQKLREKMWQALGFGDDTAENVMLMMVEEVGELAKALRKRIGLKCDVAKNNFSSVGEEAADVFNLLLDLCNLCDVDLFDEFKDKSEKHMDRVWKGAK